MPTRQAKIVVDLGYGDAGKGTIIDYLTRHHNAHTVVRFNGGAQAAHNVITPDGKHHTFAQFGSGMFLPDVRTFLSRFMLVEPYAMFNEADHLHALGVHHVFARTDLDRRALIITPFHQAANRLREVARGNARHGSCGLGIGETMADWLKVGDDMIFAGNLPHAHTVKRKLRRLRDAKWAEIADIRAQVVGNTQANAHLEVFTDDHLIDIATENYAYLAEQLNLVDEDALKARLNRDGTVLFEAAQGILLDEWYGFAPYTTWSTTTFENAETLLNSADYDGERTRIGVLRAYFCRHGAGPFVTEDEGLRPFTPEPHNVTSEWQQAFRVGYFDLVAAKYALKITGKVDDFALTHIDRIANFPEHKLCTAYRFNDDPALLDDYFVHDNGLISAIMVKSPPDLAHQTRLAQLLFDCTPVYEMLNATTIDPYLSAIETCLQTPITLLSAGATAEDKEVRLPIT